MGRASDVSRYLATSTVCFVRGISDTRRVSHGVRQVMLFINAGEQVRHRSDGVDGHVFTAVCLVVQRHVHRLLKLVRLCALLSTPSSYGAMNDYRIEPFHAVISHTAVAASEPHRTHTGLELSTCTSKLPTSLFS